MAAALAVAPMVEVPLELTDGCLVVLLESLESSRLTQYTVAVINEHEAGMMSSDTESHTVMHKRCVKHTNGKLEGQLLLTQKVNTALHVPRLKTSPMNDVRASTIRHRRTRVPLFGELGRWVEHLKICSPL